MIYVLSVAVATLILTGCAKVPQVEIDEAKAALEQAKTAEANLYVEADYLAVQDSLNAAMVGIEAQSSKMFKNYTKSKEQLAAVVTQANEMITKTDVRKEEIKSEIVQAEVATNALIVENNMLLAKAPKGKEGKEAIDAIKLDMEAITVSVQEVAGMVSSGNLLAAQTKINAAQQKATAINAELKEVLTKAKIKF